MVLSLKNHPGLVLKILIVAVVLIPVVYFIGNPMLDNYKIERELSSLLESAGMPEAKSFTESNTYIDPNYGFDVSSSTTQVVYDESYDHEALLYSFLPYLIENEWRQIEDYNLPIAEYIDENRNDYLLEAINSRNGLHLTFAHEKESRGDRYLNISVIKKGKTNKYRSHKDTEKFDFSKMSISID